jgi:hypothetical protein
MAASGRLPGAARIGKLWTFDHTKIKNYLADAEAQCQSKIFTNEMEFGGCELPSTAAKSEKAYESAMLKLLGGSGTRGFKKSHNHGRVSRRQVGRTR